LFYYFVFNFKRFEKSLEERVVGLEGCRAWLGYVS